MEDVFQATPPRHGSVALQEPENWPTALRRLNLTTAKAGELARQHWSIRFPKSALQPGMDISARQSSDGFAFDLAKPDRL
jgi:hypothetical protein